ncbi:hypothetical protein jhhlp_007882 [Lomentospora prolificans]|uniref:Tyrosinase copper-binding domain-containing protein n=1 Tax=Lomentospora prolificans TaxID=41688 RepID=A0A2N3N0U6_9PEZI|nr:hypothetical protein jhhlp_007882 [Lomentospora prolificans]
MTLKSAFLALIATLLLARSGASNPWRRETNAYPVDIVDELQDEGLERLASYLAKNPPQSNCTLETAAKRMEWHREEYTAAVLCLQSLPSRAPEGAAPGAISRYDDFVAIHILFIDTLHTPAHILPAHRLYTYLYEQALREECGYTGYQPYWNWGRYADDPASSPLFDGTMASLGGNGEPVDYPGATFPYPPPWDHMPPGGGGGCVTDGPFKDMTVTLGPVAPVPLNISANPQPNGLGYNPRCLRRDLNKFASAVTTHQHTFDLIVESETADAFHDRMMGMTLQDWGVHVGGHYTINGDPGGDPYVSPGDPAFYFHHGMIDRVWWIWQLQDPENRMTLVPGQDPKAAAPLDWAGTLFDHYVSEYPFNPGEAGFEYEEYLDTDAVDFGWLAGPWTLRELADTVGTTGGEFCYIYV